MLRRMRRIEARIAPRANRASQGAAQLLWSDFGGVRRPAASLSTNHGRGRAPRHRADTSRLRRRSGLAAWDANARPQNRERYWKITPNAADR